jgi:hypothetical protein
VRSTSSISARTSRMISVVWNSASVIDGRISERNPLVVSRPVVHQPTGTGVAAPEARQPAELHGEHEDQQDARSGTSARLTPTSDAASSTCAIVLLRRSAV